MKSLLLFICCVFLLHSCKKDETTPSYVYGKNHFIIEHQGDEREYYVHVPAVYQENEPIPVVVMLHGTSGDGDRFYNISGWKELGETDTILTVFPSSWHHCVFDEGQMNHTTKWNVYPGSFTYCAGEIPRDDIGFLRKMVDDLDAKFNIDRKRMYIEGFSNGGQMAGRCAVEMSDVFAAAVQNAGSLPNDTTLHPKGLIPVLMQVGNEDDRFTGSDTTIFPMEQFETLLNTPGYVTGVINTYIRSFQLDSMYSISGHPENALIATYTSNPPLPHRVFHFVLVEGLKHNYPNGQNHPLKGAEVHWNWFKQFSLP